MAAVFETWTVLPHEPIERLAANLWTVQGTMPDGKTKRRMTLARLDDGRVIVHNAIALEEPLMAELEGFGHVAVVAVPNGYHRQDARIWAERFPSAMVVCPRGSAGRVRKVTRVDGSYDDAPKDEHVELFHFRGTKEREGGLLVRSPGGTTLVVNDVLCNLPRLSGVAGFVFAPTGKPSVPRVSRWFLVSDKRALARHFSSLGDEDKLQRLIVAHGRIIEGPVPSTLRVVAHELTA